MGRKIYEIWTNRVESVSRLLWCHPGADEVQRRIYTLSLARRWERKPLVFVNLYSDCRHRESRELQWLVSNSQICLLKRHIWSPHSLLLYRPVNSVRAGICVHAYIYTKNRTRHTVRRGRGDHSPRDYVFLGSSKHTAAGPQLHQVPMTIPETDYCSSSRLQLETSHSWPSGWLYPLQPSSVRAWWET